MKTFLKMIVAVIVATFMAAGLIMLGASDNAVLSAYFFGTIGLCLVLGVFDEHDCMSQAGRARHERLKNDELAA